MFISVTLSLMEGMTATLKLFFLTLLFALVPAARAAGSWAWSSALAP